MNKIIKTIIICSSLFITQNALANQPAAKPVETAPAVVTKAAASAGQVNINTADAATLAKDLDGIGDVKAKAIVDYRTQNGPFKTIDDLAKVAGIGAATLEKNKNKIVLQ